MRKLVIILRGLPGSGKSTLAHRICGSPDHGIHRLIVSADHYFETDDGYQFDPDLLSEAHDVCWRRFLIAFEDKNNPIIVDNTNIRRSEFQRYLDKAAEMCYDVLEVTLGNPRDPESVRGKSVHPVPHSTIERRSKLWED